MKDRVYVDTRPAGGVSAVAEGRASLGIALMSEITADPRVDLVGPLPQNVQTYVVFAIGMAAGTQAQPACRAFSAFLGTPQMRRKLRKAGMEQPRYLAPFFAITKSISTAPLLWRNFPRYSRCAM